MFNFLSQYKNQINAKKILDIGANNGQFCKGIKKIFPDAHVTSIEAGAKYKKNLQECADEVHIAVLGNERKIVDMYLIETKPGKPSYSKGSNLFGNGKHKDQRHMQLLSDVVENNKFDFIKQDVQGAEIMIMEGAPEIFSTADFVLNEVNLHTSTRGEPDIDTMHKFMTTLGFNFNYVITDYQEKNNQQTDVLYCKKAIF